MEGVPLTPEPKYIKSAEILDGKGAASLEASARVYEFASGDIVIAGTDKGIDYKERNEDRVIIAPEQNFVAVIDGMGGYEDGEKAAEISATSFLQNPENINLAVEKAKGDMEKYGLAKTDGAVFISARITAETMPNGSVFKFLEMLQLGDAKLLVIREGAVFFESKDQSTVQDFIDIGEITTDQALYHPLRHRVSAAISRQDSKKPKSYPKIKLENGDVVLLMSDGTSDNLTAEEIADEKRKHSLSPRQLFTRLSDITTARMQKADEIASNTADRAAEGVYSDGYKSKPKKDNRSLVIIEIK